MSDINPKVMLERRISEKVFDYFFPNVEIDTRIKCPFCGHVKSFRIVKKIFEPKVLIGICNELTCQFNGGAHDLIRRWYDLSHRDVYEIMKVFDTDAGYGEIKAEIDKRIQARNQVRRRTFQN
ncbi:MAG: hypothetical protein SCARUB_01194 [Candidatus Scalindua rubra]|uniref:Uncharacterized protein n=1 Tax=Candidatus Scalindua rubra TaxID=1872076 RepID=A0A1E3XFF1_9BACT|nr:MAG: hypothetical protein SCARUB_01194 [Candidatus Scalindua rubra]